MENNRNELYTFADTNCVIISQMPNKPSYRNNIVLINNSTNGSIITISVDKQIVNDGEGSVIYPGGKWSDTSDGNYLPTQKLIFAKSTAAGGTLAIQERIINPVKSD